MGPSLVAILTAQSTACNEKKKSSDDDDDSWCEGILWMKRIIKKNSVAADARHFDYKKKVTSQCRPLTHTLVGIDAREGIRFLCH